MSKRAVISLLQNAAILLLSISAAFLLLQVISFETGSPASLSQLFAPDSSSGKETTYSTDLSAMAAPYNLVVTGTYGRSSTLLGDGGRETDEKLLALLQEALGSAEEVIATEEAAFRHALSYPGFYLDYLTPINADVVAGRLGASFSQFSPVRRILLSDEGFDSVVLYLWDGSGSVFRYKTAASSAVLNEAIATYTSDDTFFAFEGGEEYVHLDPYTLMRRSTVSPAVISAATPALAGDSDQLLSLLDFNVHTESRYQLSNGTEVIVESPRSLRILPDGSIEYDGDENTASELFRVYSSGSSPTAAEAVLAARNLTEALFSGSDFADTELYLSQVQSTATGYSLTFDYLVNSLPVYFSDDSHAMTVTITDATITHFTLRWRQYTISEETYTLLPVRQVAAIATQYDHPYLSVGYADNGAATIRPGWLAR